MLDYRATWQKQSARHMQALGLPFAHCPGKRFLSKRAARIDIGIDEKDRAAIAAGLSKRLAHTYTLYLTTHNFHWNASRVPCSTRCT